MLDGIISKIFYLQESDEVYYMSYFSDEMTDSEKLRDVEILESKVSSILEDIQKYKKSLKPHDV